jgi:hypothetical protein
MTMRIRDVVLMSMKFLFFGLRKFLLRKRILEINNETKVRDTFNPNKSDFHTFCIVNIFAL